MSDITERAYEATVALLAKTSNAPMTGEIAKLLEDFAMNFACEVAYKLCSSPDSEGAALAVRNVLDRAAKGEP